LPLTVLPHLKERCSNAFLYQEFQILYNRGDLEPAMIFGTFIRSFFCIFSVVPACLLAALPESHPFDPLFLQEPCEQKSRLLSEGNELLEAGLYDQAIIVYRKVLKEADESTAGSDEDLSSIELAMQARFHLAQAYLAQEKSNEALDILLQNVLFPKTPASRKIQQDSLYLTALTYKAQKKYAEALEALQEYLKNQPAHSLDYSELAAFEIGQINFLMGRHEEAKKQLSALEREAASPRLQALAKLHLSRLALIEGHGREAAAILESLPIGFPKDDILLVEKYYWQGEAAFQMHSYSEAKEFFEKAIANPSSKKNSWYPETLYRLGWSYLKIGDDSFKDPQDRNACLQKAEEIFQRLIEAFPSEKAHLALAQCYLAQAARLKEEEPYKKAEALLSKAGVFVSKEAQSHALLLRAAAAPSYALREQLYRQLTLEADNSGTFYAKGWYMYAMNDFDRGLSLTQSGQQEEAAPLFARAASSFKKAFDLLKDTETSLAGAALKFQALATSYTKSPSADLEAYYLLDAMIKEHEQFWQSLEVPDEVLYLHGFFASRLADKDAAFNEKAGCSLKSAAAYENGKFGDQALLQLGSMHYLHKNYQAAEAAYIELTEKFPSSPFCGEAWFWAACCSDKLEKDPKVGKQRRRNAFDNFPQSPYAAEAYFTFYTYQDYLQGDRNAIKHLQNFAEKYPETPFLIEAYYLLGLDYKRDRKTPDGKWVRKKNLTEAIDAFQEVETLFDAFKEKGIIKEEQLYYYTNARYRATLERALVNLAIADESQGAKREIYLEYAEEVFKSLVDDFKKSDDSPAKLLAQENPYPPLYEESSFWLAQTYMKNQNDQEAERILTEMLDQYRQIRATRGYYLSRVWYELGRIAMRRNAYPAALQLLKNSEESSKGNVLGTDQKLDLWIQQSLCCRGMDQYDQAIWILSRVINDDAISSLRLKAMFLRAETYELQGRHELARKQLESMTKKGGIWAQKAQEKLEKDYGN
jgi:tetratricopeptide (TPR) repeat protein